MRAAVALALTLSCTPLRSSMADAAWLVARLAPNQFAVAASPAALPKWQRIRDWLTADGGTANPALAEWTSWAISLRGRPVLEQLIAIDVRVNQRFRYASDMEVWGAADYWETPAEVVAKGATDCEGFAIFKYWLARLVGIPDDTLTLSVGIVISTHQMHAVLVAGAGGRSYVLDDRSSYVVDTATFGDFRMLATIDLQEIEVFVRGFGPRAPAASAAR